MIKTLISVLMGTLLFSADQGCPAYPKARRTSDRAKLDFERSAYAFSTENRGKRLAIVREYGSANFIDDYIFDKMAQEGVQPAPLTTDEEILRRLSLDLTGRLPTPQQVTEFVNNQNPSRRSDKIDELIASPAFVDYWTFVFGNHFEVGSKYYNFIGITGRNLFYYYLRDFISKDRSYKDVATELITAKGDSQLDAATNFILRAQQPAPPPQDTYDAIAHQISSKFLGVQLQCVSCHDGYRHLEGINLYLTSRKREEFWRQSAFYSRTNIFPVSVDPLYQQLRFIVTDRAAGSYSSAVDPNNPGQRPTRSGGPYNARYFFTQEGAQTDDWRAELARFITSDRQFARATVNYLWAHFFTDGIVDPPDGWDLSRINPKNPPPEPWTLQPSHPELIEALADEFIRSNFSIRHMIKLMVQSNAYQLSSRYPGQWRPDYERYFARHLPRRLYAEEIYDAVTTATSTEVPMFVEGFNAPLYYATQLPDPTEPRPKAIGGVNDPKISDFLLTFGRGDWFEMPRNSTSNVLQVLYAMNDEMINFRTFGNRNVTTRVTRIMQAGLSDTDAVHELFLATLGRYATNAELELLLKKKTANYEQWLSDIQWALLNKVDFVFNN